MCWALFICVGEREAAYSIVHQSHMLGRARLGQGALPRVVGGPSAARDERRFAGNYPGTSRRNMNARESPTDLAFADEKPKQTRFIFRCPFVLRHSPNANICPSFVTIFSGQMRFWIFYCEIILRTVMNTQLNSKFFD